jgi:FMN phosphatase YigB (HAD superfamily)
MNSASCIALDVGNCCIQVRTEECLRRIGARSLEDVPPEFIAACGKFECGMISASRWLAEFRRSTGGRFSDEKLLEAWMAIIGDEIDGMPEALKEITDSGCRVIFFSDTSDIHIKHTILKMTLSVYVSGGIYSYEVGERKPSAKMFEAFEKKYGIPLLYTDDKDENISAGLQRGWNAVKFESAKKILNEFRKIRKQI